MDKAYKLGLIESIMVELSKTYTNESAVYDRVYKAFSKLSVSELDSIWSMVITSK